ncbi:hypothetical protein [Catenulispora pinisilvae]|uniref:hypothetical protein n=1 Tax=Catenulispora pinisilvae TaxID=2705253 RepID=UPI001891F79B|nr:hypothetical protein [Catenulispora pinisilvae]
MWTVRRAVAEQGAIAGQFESSSFESSSFESGSSKFSRFEPGRAVRARAEMRLSP